MNINHDNLSDWESRMLLETVWHFITPDIRRKVMDVSPALYNKACGWDVVDIRHGSVRISVNGRTRIETGEEL